MATPHPVVVRIVSHTDVDIEVVKGEMKRLMRQREVVMMLNQHIFTEPRVCTIWRKDTEKLIAWTVFHHSTTPKGKTILKANEIIYDRRLSESELIAYLAEFMKEIGIKIRPLKQKSETFFKNVLECRIQVQGLNESVLDSLPPLSGTRKADSWIITL